MTPKTLFEKICALHAVHERDDGETLLYVDYNVVHEGPFYAFDGLRAQGRVVRRPRQTVAFADHYVPTVGRQLGLEGIADPEARKMVEQLARNTAEAGIMHFGLAHRRQGIMHVVAPELGLVHPGMVIVGSDSHTSTNGAFGTFAYGVGASQVQHALATQAVWYRKPKVMRVRIEGVPRSGVTAKDVSLAFIAQVGVGGATGHVVEYCGSAVRAMSMEGRMTLCNMSIESGARTGMIAPDETTYAYLQACEHAPKEASWQPALAYWQQFFSDQDAAFDADIRMDGAAIEPMVTWGTYQDEASPVSATIPDPQSYSDPGRRDRAVQSLSYMQLAAGDRISDIRIDRVFIGSCTNARLEDLRDAARIAEGRTAKIPAIVVPGSMSVKRAAEAEGLHEIFLRAGFEWREPGCSMCTGSNGDRVPSGERCASTSNRNFEGRQGRGSRTHLVSPAMAVIAATTGRLGDASELA